MSGRLADGCCLELYGCLPAQRGVTPAAVMEANVPVHEDPHSGHGGVSMPVDASRCVSRSSAAGSAGLRGQADAYGPVATRSARRLPPGASAAAILASAGHDADTVVAEHLAGAPDSDVVTAATAAGRILITLDRGMGDIRAYPPGSHAGIVVLRLAATA